MIFGVFIIAALTVLVRLRTLTFSAMTANFDGVVSVMSRFEPFRPRPRTPATCSVLRCSIGRRC